MTAERAGAPLDEWFVDLCVSHGTESRQAFTVRLLAAWPKIKAALLSEIEPQEPVGWRYVEKETGIETMTAQPPDRVTRPEDYVITPLYAAPQGSESLRTQGRDSSAREAVADCPAESASSAACVAVPLKQMDKWMRALRARNLDGDDLVLEEMRLLKLDSERPKP